MDTPQLQFKAGKLTNQIKELQELCQHLHDKLFKAQQNIAYLYKVLEQKGLVKIEDGKVVVTE